MQVSFNRGESTISTPTTTGTSPNKVTSKQEDSKNVKKEELHVKQPTDEQIEKITKEKLQEAVDSVNELLKHSSKRSQFIMHDGLDRYYVQLVDSETEEVIKEIPPKQLLDAFYEMKKLAGMIVDEKI